MPNEPRRSAGVDICKLTGRSGRFVKSHIIPKALTRPQEKGGPFVQYGGAQRPNRRFDSWYDSRLVIQDGEDILTDLDTFAINELRRLKLIWQSWGPMTRLCMQETESFAGTPNGIRRVVFSDAGKMRLFFLSLLWRCAVSDRKEFSEIEIRPSQLRRVRACIRGSRQPSSWSFYPITLTQISTRGLSHIHAPVRQVKLPITFAGHTSKAHDIIRFFLDGLIAHVHLPIQEAQIDDLWPMMVGPVEGTTLSTVTWEDSQHILNFASSIAEAEASYPGRILDPSGALSAALAWAPVTSQIKR